MKMTLTFDEETIAIAKEVARIEGCSVSSLVRTFFKLRANSLENKSSKLNPRLKKLLDESESIKTKHPKISDKDLINKTRMEKYG